MNLENFRLEIRDWLETNCPPRMRLSSSNFEDMLAAQHSDEGKLWARRAAERGFVAPAWDKKYGGAGLNKHELDILNEEMRAIHALRPASGMGLAMIGPTLLELGTEEQRMRHLPKIASAEVVWCQGYSEPGAGSDLASLQTKAVLEGDQFIINGQKIWTSGAHLADWMFVLVRTDPEAPKHQGISFMLLDMHQPGVTVKPIKLISGSSPFCETFFDNAIARKEDLIGNLNEGWTVAKRLLQFERTSTPEPAPTNHYGELAKTYVGESDGKLANSMLRDCITRQVMQEQANALTLSRIYQESASGGAPGAATSIFKFVGATLDQNSSELMSRIRGTNGLVWESEAHSAEELGSTRGWLTDRATTIYGGSNEVQLNIIAKRVLGLPD